MVRLDDATGATLAALSEKAGRAPEEIAAEAIIAQVAREAWIIAMIEKGITDIEADRIADGIEEAATHLGLFSTGRTGATLENAVPRLPDIVVYRIVRGDAEEVVNILRVIHGARDWPPGGWPDED